MEANKARKIVLIVDDTPDNVSILNAALMNEYDIKVATRGKKAIEIAMTTPVDIILLDVMMPEMDGFETCRRLKEEPQTRSIPVIFITAALKASKDQADADLQKQQAEIAKAKQDLSDSEKRTADARAELDKQAALQASKDKADADSQRQQAEMKANKDKADADSQRQQAEIAKGKQDLSDSEMRTSAAMAELAAIAAVKEEERGLVVTLSGGVLFRSAESTLMDSAMIKLDQVANALLSVHARNIVVEGHTDSQGSKSYNQGLSQRRADAVRDYLMQKGYPADRIQARGKGEGTSIANNASPEGRANNRRVEIVIERELQASNP